MVAAIVSLTEVRAHLNKTSTVNDGELEGFISAATGVVEYHIGPVVEQEKTERHHGPGLGLWHPPVLALTSVTAVLTGGTSWNVAELTVDNDTGIVQRLNGHALYGGPWDVTYTAGRATVSGDIKTACMIIVGHLWETQRGRMTKLPVGGGIDNVPVSAGISYAVPRRALELLRPHSGMAGIA
jgi:hypothetical protein